MKYFIAIWVIIVLIGMLYISFVNFSEYVVSSLIIVGICAFTLFRVFKFALAVNGSDGSGKDDPPGGGGSGGCPDPLDYVIFGDIANDDNWDDL